MKRVVRQDLLRSQDSTKDFRELESESETSRGTSQSVKCLEAGEPWLRLNNRRKIRKGEAEGVTGRSEGNKARRQCKIGSHGALHTTERSLAFVLSDLEDHG